MLLITRFSLVLTSGVLLLNSSCQKTVEEAECAQLTQAPPAFLAYWYFPVGSYWVYRLRNSNPAVLDTVRVQTATAEHITRAEDGVNWVPCVQFYATYRTHSNQTYFPGTGQKGGEYLNAHPLYYQTTWYVEHSSQVRTLYSPILSFGYPFRIGEKLLNTVSVLDTTAVVTPAGTFARSVHVVPDYGTRTDSTQANWIRHLYLTRGIGVTRTVYTNNQTWELLVYRLAL